MFTEWLTQEYRDAQITRISLTAKGYAADVEQFCRWHQERNGTVATIENLSGTDAREWLAQFHSPTTYNRKLAALRCWVRWGHDVELLYPDFDPLRRIKSSKVAHARKWIDRVGQSALQKQLDIQEGGALTDWKRVQRIQDQAIYAILRYGGLRVAELCALELADIEIETNERGKARLACIRIKHGKGNKPRIVYIPSHAVDEVERWQLARPDVATSALFVGQRGPLSPRSVEARIKELGRLAGIELTPHMLRHTYAKETLNSGTDIRTLQELLGHESIVTTSLYTTPDAHDFRAAAARMD